MRPNQPALLAIALFLLAIGAVLGCVYSTAAIATATGVLAAKQLGELMHTHALSSAASGAHAYVG